MTQKELSANRFYLESIKNSLVYKQLAVVFSFPLAYRLVRYQDVEMFREGGRIGDIKLKFKHVYVQISGSRGLERKALFVKIGTIEHFKC